MYEKRVNADIKISVVYTRILQGLFTKGQGQYPFHHVFGAAGGPGSVVWAVTHDTGPRVALTTQPPLVTAHTTADSGHILLSL